jgi:hypothetical protein
VPGCRVDALLLVTTLLDGDAYTRADVADVFLRRWAIELDLRSIKCTLKLHIFGSKTLAVVRKAIWMHMLADHCLYMLVYNTCYARGGTHPSAILN